MSKETDLARIVDFVSHSPGATFVELVQLDPEFKGHYEMLLGEELGEIVLWEGMSEGFVDALNLGLNTMVLTMKPASVFSYLHDGAMLTLPLVKSENYKYKTRHWLPVVFYLAADEPEWMYYVKEPLASGSVHVRKLSDRQGRSPTGVDTSSQLTAADKLE